MLAGWRGVDGGDALPVERRVEGVGLDKRVGIIGLRFDVDADDVETGAVVAGGGAAGATEQIDEERALVHRSSAS